MIKTNVMNHDTRRSYRSGKLRPARTSLILNSFRQTEFAPVKLKGSIAVGPQVGNAMASRVEMELVRNFEGIECLVQFARPAVEAIRVFRAAIDVYFHFQKSGRIFPRQHVRAVQIP